MCVFSCNFVFATCFSHITGRGACSPFTLIHTGPLPPAWPPFSASSSVYYTPRAPQGLSWWKWVFDAFAENSDVRRKKRLLPPPPISNLSPPTPLLLEEGIAWQVFGEWPPLFPSSLPLPPFFLLCLISPSSSPPPCSPLYPLAPFSLSPSPLSLLLSLPSSSSLHSLQTSSRSHLSTHSYGRSTQPASRNELKLYHWARSLLLPSYKMVMVTAPLGAP